MTTLLILQYIVLSMLVFVLSCILIYSVYQLWKTWRNDKKDIKAKELEEDTEEDLEAEEVSPMIKYSKNYLDYNKYVLDFIDSLVTAKIETRVVKDRMAGTSNISENEVIEIRDDILDEFYASIPNGFQEIINELYLPNQIKLVLSNTLYKRIAQYYKIYPASKNL